MAETIHTAATHHLPSFITAPGETDVLMVVMSVILAIAILAFGIVFFRLHTLPERVAHKTQKVQFEVVAVLGLIALFTHMHIFWLIGLLLALVDLPDFGTPLRTIAGSVEQMAGSRRIEEPAAAPSLETPSEAQAHYDKEGRATRQRAVGPAPPIAPELATAVERNRGHA